VHWPTFISVPAAIDVPAVTLKAKVLPVTVLMNATLLPAFSVVAEPIVAAPYRSDSRRLKSSLARLLVPFT
jgi:hypothetical protein